MYLFHRYIQKKIALQRGCEFVRSVNSSWGLSHEDIRMYAFDSGYVAAGLVLIDSSIARSNVLADSVCKCAKSIHAQRTGPEKV